MSEEWSEWIEHQGSDCPCVGKIIQFELKSGVKVLQTGTRYSTMVVAVNGSAWKSLIARYRIKKTQGPNHLRKPLSKSTQGGGRMTDKAPERIWTWSEPTDRGGVDKFWMSNPLVLDGLEIEYIRADIHQALEAERDELAAALDSKHAVVGSNIWRFWSQKACETADRNLELIAERDRLRGALEEIQGVGFDMPMTLELTGEQWAQRRSSIMQRIAGSALEDKQ